MKRIINFIICTVLLCVDLSAQMTINTSSNANALVASIKGEGVTISNAVKSAPSANTAAFDNGSSTNIGLPKGILLSTGTAAAINGLATSSANTNSGGSGYSLLNSLAGAPTYDAAVLEFDLITTCNTLEIQYVFGAEEYPDYVGTIFNDAFGFFISGPDPTGGTYVNENFALVPSTNTPISVNTVNNGDNNSGPCMNCAYYKDNSTGSSIKYNGFTIPITSRVKVNPGSTYHLILAIADGNDANEDASVLISSGGLTCSSSLPVELTRFSGEKSNKGNLLKWSTSSETNSSYFMIERSFDGKVFEEAGKINASNNSKHEIKYEFRDKQFSFVLNPYIFYKISQVDVDGQISTMDKIVFIKNTKETNDLLLNPILPEDGKLSIKLLLENSDQIELILSDANGVLVFEEQKFCVNGLNELDFDLGTLANGLYYLKTVTSSQIFNSKILKY